MIDVHSNDFVLTFPCEGLAASSASARFRVWQPSQGALFVLATQLPQVEYQGPSITEAAPFAIKAMCDRFGPEFAFVEHYNRASYGLELYEPTFNLDRYVIEPHCVRVIESPVLSIADVQRLTGLTEADIRRL